MENENNMNNTSQEENGLSLGEILLIIRKHLIAIIIFIVCFSAAGMGLAIYKDNKSPRYTAYSTMLINVRADAEDQLSKPQQYQLGYYMSTTFAEFIPEDVVLEPVAKKYEKEGLSVGSLRGNLGLEIKNESLIIQLTFTSNNPEKSADILNDIMESTIKIANTEEISHGTTIKKYPLLHSNISVLTKASKDKYSLSSSKMKYTVIFFALGAVVAAAYVVLRELLDNSFKSTEQVEKELGLRVISSIPLYQFKNHNVAEKEGDNK